MAQAIKSPRDFRKIVNCKAGFVGLFEHDPFKGELLVGFPLHLKPRFWCPYFYRKGTCRGCRNSRGNKEITAGERF